MTSPISSRAFFRGSEALSPAVALADDIPGASLNGRDPSSLKIPELKRWLLCRGASVRGKKADLVLR